MQGLRTIAAIVAGFGFMASTVMVGNSGDRTLLPGICSRRPASLPTVAACPANLVSSLIGAVMGGWLAARIGASAPLAHAVALAALTAVLRCFPPCTPPAAQPAWYPFVIGIIGVAGVLLGGKLRAAAAEAESGRDSVRGRPWSQLNEDRCFVLRVRTRDGYSGRRSDR